MKFTLGLLMGAAIGGIVAHYLHSEEGSALTRKIRRDATDISDNLTGIADMISEKAKSLVGKKEEAPDEQIVIVGLTQDPLA